MLFLYQITFVLHFSHLHNDADMLQLDWRPGNFDPDWLATANTTFRIHMNPRNVSKKIWGSRPIHRKWQATVWLIDLSIDRRFSETIAVNMAASRTVAVEVMAVTWPRFVHSENCDVTRRLQVGVARRRSPSEQSGQLECGPDQFFWRRLFLIAATAEVSSRALLPFRRRDCRSNRKTREK